MSEFKINDIEYKAAKMDGLTQLFVFKKIAPSLLPVIHLLGKTQLNSAEITSLMDGKKQLR
jgi:hypothetical protein